MDIIIRRYSEKDIPSMAQIWNEIVEEGTAFPQENYLNEAAASEFFGSQTYTGVAANKKSGEILGLYILHPNNIGRCGHICNASYAVRSDMRGMHIGEKLVKDCMMQAKKHGFGILQFNAVVKTNYGARHLYEKLGFTPLGIIPDGFRMKNGKYEDIIPHYITL
ncbi:MAG: GNAT family N-acetyltransferase [Clostridia bacterium]|nr:GNAT family N-acetyltransferase [Clostridia bacterium]